MTCCSHGVITLALYWATSQIFSLGSAQLLVNNGKFSLKPVKRNATEEVIPCIYDVPGKSPEIKLYLNRSVIASSNNESYKSDRGFTVKLPQFIPLTGISYECRVHNITPQQRTTFRLIPEEVTKSTPRDRVEVVLNETLKLQCSTEEKSWAPVKIVHNFTDIKSSCNVSGREVECHINARKETAGHYHCIQDTGTNTNNILQTQILSHWAVETISERVRVEVKNGDVTLSCSVSFGNSSTLNLEYCPCQNDEMCATIINRLKKVSGCKSAKGESPPICNLTGTQSPTVSHDFLEGMNAVRCYAQVMNSEVNCNHDVLKYVPRKGISRTALVWVITVISVCLILALILIVVYRQKFIFQKFKVQKLTEAEVEEFLHGNLEAIDRNEDINEQAHLLPYNKDFEFPKANLHFEKQLGAGAYGTVMRARAEGLLDGDGKPVLTVAVKTVPPNAEFEYFKALLMELKVMIHLGKHVNVVALLGAVTEKIQRREVYIIVEFCRFGDLQSYLEKNGGRFVNQIEKGKIDPKITKNRPTDYANLPAVPDDEAKPKENVYLNVGESTAIMDTYANVEPDVPDADLFCTMTLVIWSYQIAKGMEYLDSRKVMHGDLAARNVLIADNLVAKVADFGLARRLYKNPEYEKTQKQKLPIKWMAPESLTRLIFSPKSDVWSYGITLHEMFTLGETPYPGMDIGESFLEQIQQGYRMKQSRFCPKELYKLMIGCWQHDPNERPSFQELGMKLGSLISSLDSNYIRLSTCENAPST